MILSFPTRQLAFCLTLFLCILLQGCAGSEKTKSGIKIGMHIDAVLEFIVEYPLSWSKDRRLSYGSKEGEVRWTHPDYPHTLLTIKSYLHKQQDLSQEQQIDQALHEYPGLQVLKKENVTLPAGDAWHITGRTTLVNLDIHLFLHADRTYMIILSAPANGINSFETVMERVTHSFQSMSREPPDAKASAEPRDS